MTNDDELKRYRTFWPRIGAAFLDGAALAPIMWINQLLWSSTSNRAVLSLWSAFETLLALVFSVGFVARFGQTPGKMACRIKVVRLDGTPAALKEALLRDSFRTVTAFYFLFVRVSNIAKRDLAEFAFGSHAGLLWAGGVVSFWVLLEFVTMVTNEKRRAIHDYIAGTVVVRTGEPGRNGLALALIALMVSNFFVSRYFQAGEEIRAIERSLGPASFKDMDEASISHMKECLSTLAREAAPFRVGYGQIGKDRALIGILNVLLYDHQLDRDEYASWLKVFNDRAAMDESALKAEKWRLIRATRPHSGGPRGVVGEYAPDAAPVDLADGVDEKEAVVLAGRFMKLPAGYFGPPADKGSYWEMPINERAFLVRKTWKQPVDVDKKSGRAWRP